MVVYYKLILILVHDISIHHFCNIIVNFDMFCISGKSKNYVEMGGVN